jgi:hypothetical protein
MKGCFKLKEKATRTLKNWQYLLERRQWKEQVLSGFPNSKKCVC